MVALDLCMLKSPDQIEIVQVVKLVLQFLRKYYLRPNFLGASLIKPCLFILVYLQVSCIQHNISFGEYEAAFPCMDKFARKDQGTKT